MNRRNVLEVLGLSAATMAVSTEAIAKAIPVNERVSYGLAEPSHEAQERIAAALEKLAGEIRRNKVTAKNLNVQSDLTWNEWVDHVVSVKIEITG